MQNSRLEFWLDFDTRLGHGFDWSGLEKYRAYTWMYEIPHLFFAPFYWIEYLFGQLGALQLLKNFTEEPGEAVDRLKRAMALGSTKALPELFAAAGISFSITPKLLQDLLQFVDHQFATLGSRKNCVA